MDIHYYRNEIINMMDSLPEGLDEKFLNEFASFEKNPVIAFGFNSWIGCFGADRFYVGDILLGVLKLITFGGLGIWVLIDCFLIGNRCRTKNLEKARQIFTRYSGRLN